MTIPDLLIFVVILSLNAFFCAAETALTAARIQTVHAYADKGSAVAATLLRLLRDRARVVSALLIGQNVVGAVLAVYSTRVIDNSLGEQLPPWAAALTAILISITLLLVFGEVIPKSMAVRFATRWSLLFAYPVKFVATMMYPLTWLLSRLSGALLRLLGQGNTDQPEVTVEEIQALARLGQSHGVIDGQEMEIVQRASVLNETKVHEIMTPRTDIQSIDVSSTPEQIREYFKKAMFTRVPVHRDGIDDIVGILNIKEFLRHDSGRQRGFDLLNYLHKPLFVPRAMSIGNLLQDMRKRRTHIAIALDEYGGTAGLIALEDIVEMLVGRIDDEYDDDHSPVEQVDAQTWNVDGRVTDEQLVSQLRLALPPEAVAGFDTVAGLALKAFGNIPSEGDVTTYYGLEIKVLQVQGHRVRRVQVKVPLPGEAAPEGDSKTSTRRKTQRIKTAPVTADYRDTPAEADMGETDETPRDEPLKDETPVA